MLSDITRSHETDIGGTDDVLRTRIAVYGDGVKPLSALESSPSGGRSVVESGNSLVAQWWLESGERLARLTPGTPRRDAAPTLTGMGRSGPRESREAAARTGGGKLLCAVLALGAGMVAR